jgi:hypothetical protein
MLWLVALLVMVYLPVVVAVGLQRPAMHDEPHFIRTIQRFADQPTLATLRVYNEMSTPLPFVVYAAWGRAFGFEPATLRTLSLVIALGSYAAICLFMLEQFKDVRVAVGLTALIAIHPYMMALSVLVYTDMLAIGLGALACWALLRREAWVLGLSLAGAMLCRQYAIVFPVAFAVYLWIEHGKDMRRMLTAVALSVVPLAWLVWFWGVLSPQNATARKFADEAMLWHPSSAVLYVAIGAVYLAPLLVWRRKAIYGPPKVLPAALILGAAYWLFPVRPSEVFYHPSRVGLFDALLHRAFDAVWMRDVVFWIAFMLGLPLIYAAVRQVRVERSSALTAWNWVLLAFVAIMPLSYLHWEKYYMLIFPAAVALVWGHGREEHA